MVAPNIFGVLCRLYALLEVGPETRVPLLPPGYATALAMSKQMLVFVLYGDPWL